MEKWHRRTRTQKVNTFVTLAAVVVVVVAAAAAAIITIAVHIPVVRFSTMVLITLRGRRGTVEAANDVVRPHGGSHHHHDRTFTHTIAFCFTSIATPASATGIAAEEGLLSVPCVVGRFEPLRPFNGVVRWCTS